MFTSLKTYSHMILATTPTIEGHKILDYKGVVTGETIIGANVFKDFMASIRDVFGGRSGSYERVLVEGRETALRELEQRARDMGATAVVGIAFDIEAIGPEGGMFLVSASGTAVVV